jgi:hypothetical protein
LASIKGRSLEGVGNSRVTSGGGVSSGVFADSDIRFAKKMASRMTSVAWIRQERKRRNGKRSRRCRSFFLSLDVLVTIMKSLILFFFLDGK